MLRLTEVKLPLDHPESDLIAAILGKLGIPAERLLRYSIHRRGYDARKRSNIFLIYTLDVEVRDEAENIGIFETRDPVALDQVRPTVRIRQVRPFE